MKALTLKKELNHIQFDYNATCLVFNQNCLSKSIFLQSEILKMYILIIFVYRKFLYSKLSKINQLSA